MVNVHCASVCYEEFLAYRPACLSAQQDLQPYAVTASFFDPPVITKKIRTESNAKVIRIIAAFPQNARANKTIEEHDQFCTGVPIKKEESTLFTATFQRAYFAVLIAISCE